MNPKYKLIQLGLIGAALSQAMPGGAQTTVTHIAAGDTHTLFLRSDGTLWGMGQNAYGQLGNVPTNYNTYQPVLLVTNGVTAIAAYAYQSFYQTSGSSLWAMGNNAYGQLGDGTTTDIHTPKIVSTGFGLVCGAYHTLFVRGGPNSSRDLDAMGYNHLGELGDGTTNNQSAPEKIERDSTIIGGVNYVTTMAAGDFHSIYVKSDSSLWGTGYNYYGELGDGTYNSTNTGEKVVPSGVTAVAAAGDRSLFIKTDGSLWGMGDNEYGQLGNPVIVAQTNKPVQIVSSNVTAVAAGYFHTVFTEADGSLWAMGANLNGALGDGTFNGTNKPERIVAGGVTAIAASTFDSHFLISDGSLWGMGANDAGELGTAPATNQPWPVQIVGPVVGNGSFETRDFLGWTQTNASAYNIVTTGGNYVHSGLYGAKMGPLGSLSFLSQTLKTLPGTNYLLSFWLNCDGLTPNQFSVSWNGTALMNKTNLAATGWTNMQFTVNATGTNTTLQFGFRDDPSYFGLDDVRVVPLSPPVITGASLAGTNLVLTASNGLWSGAYVTLSSTNLATPRSQWTRVTTNTLDGSGNFTITATNAVKTGDQKRYFALQLQ